MGILKLTGFMETSSQPPVKVAKRGEGVSVVIDGSAWLYSLCRTVAISPIEPSTYRTLRREARLRVRRFVHVYFDHVAFVFDGLYEARKQQEHLRRAAMKCDVIKKWYHALGNWEDGSSNLWLGNVLPQFARTVIFEVIREIQSELGEREAESRRLILHVCDGEADREIARISKEEGMIVLSNDSDFFLHRSVVGFVPLGKVLEGEEHVSLLLYTPAEVEKVVKLKRELFPLLAVLVGNDYTEERSLRTIHRIFGFPTELAEDVGRIRKVAEFLRKFSTLEDAFKFFSEGKSYGALGGPGLLKLMKESILLYGGGDDLAQLPASSSSAPSKSTHTPELSSKKGRTLPKRIIDRYRIGLLDALALNVLVVHEFDCPVIQEDMQRKSIWGTTRALRTLAYAHLLLPERDLGTQTVVERFFRGSPQKTPVGVDFELLLPAQANFHQLVATTDQEKIQGILSALFSTYPVAMLTLEPAELLFVTSLKFVAQKGSELKEWQLKAIMFCFVLGGDHFPPNFQRQRIAANVTGQNVHACTLWENTLLCTLLLFQAAQLAESYLSSHIDRIFDLPLLLWSFDMFRTDWNWGKGLGNPARRERFQMLWEISVGTPLKLEPPPTPVQSQPSNRYAPMGSSSSSQKKKR